MPTIDEMAANVNTAGIGRPRLKKDML